MKSAHIFLKACIHLTLAIFLVCVNSACLKIEKKDKSDTPEESFQINQDLHKSTQISYVALPEVTKYAAVINLNTHIDHADVILEKQITSNKFAQTSNYEEPNTTNQSVQSEVIFHTQMYNARQFVVDELISGFEYKIFFKLRNQKNEITNTHGFALNPPKDLIINSEYKLENNSRLDVARLHITSDGVIRNENYDLEIKAQKIIFEKGSKIENFDPSVAAPYAQAGLNAGEVRISTKEAEGEVHFVSTGQAGGVGKKGWVSYLITTRYSRAKEGADREFTTHEKYEVCHAGRGYSGGNGGRILFSATDAKKLIINRTLLESVGGQVGEVVSLYSERKSELKNSHPEQREDCGVTPVIGSNGLKGQICLKTSENEPVFCE